MNKLGFYLETTTSVPGLAEAIRELKPPTLLTHATDRGILQAIRRDLSPDTFVVGRLHLDVHEQNVWLAGDGGRADRGEWLDCDAAKNNGRAFAERILAHDFGMAKERFPNEPGGKLLIDAWMSLNECLPGPASDAWQKGSEEEREKLKAKATAFDCFQVGFRERLQQEGLEAVAFNFGAGNFQKAEHYIDWLPRTLKSYTYLGFHEYGWPTLYPDEARGSESAAGLYHECIAGIKGAFPNREYKVIITEAGMARMYHHAKKADGDVGWLFEGETLSEEDYWESLKWYNQHLVQDDYVMGACLFNVGPTGLWTTFRHLGTDNDGNPLRIVERMKGLGVQDKGVRAAQPAPITLEGRVTADNRPVAGAMVRLIGSPHTLGADPRASSHDPGASTWTQAVTGFAGNVWSAWLKFVSREAAGITYEEFKAQVAQYNPSLGETGGKFEAERTYYLPEVRTFEDTPGAGPEVVWDRQVSGFSGTKWACWRRYVQTKVAGLNWDAFEEEVAIQNPHLAEDGDRFVAAKSYLLPRNAGQYEYTRVSYANARGQCRFAELPPGRYEVEVSARGYKVQRGQIAIDVDSTIDLDLEPILEVWDKGAGLIGVEGGQFKVDGRVYRFVGVNMTGLAHYGTPQFIHTEPEDKEKRMQLQEARNMGARVVRIFLPHEQVSKEEVGNRLGRLLDLIKTNFDDMYLIVCFTDLYSDRPFHPQGDTEFLTFKSGDKTILRPDWFESGYKTNYLDLVEHIVGRFKEERNIFAWEIGNELKIDNRPKLFVEFNLAVADAIWKLDKDHLITTGIISTRQAYMEGKLALRRGLYGESSKIGFLTNHAYNGENHENDSDLAKDVNVRKPFIIEEAGFDPSHGDDRAPLVVEDMKKWSGLGASGYLQWGFVAGNRDNGDGDKSVGMDGVFHQDWESLKKTYQDAHSFRPE